MGNEKLKFRWVRIHAGWWYCPRFKLSIHKDVITGRWRAQGQADHDSADEARAAAEQHYILKCQESNKVLREVLNDDYK